MPTSGSTPKYFKAVDLGGEASTNKMLAGNHKLRPSRRDVKQPLRERGVAQLIQIAASLSPCISKLAAVEALIVWQGQIVLLYPIPVATPHLQVSNLPL